MVMAHCFLYAHFRPQAKRAMAHSVRATATDSLNSREIQAALPNVHEYRQTLFLALVWCLPFVALGLTNLW